MACKVLNLDSPWTPLVRGYGELQKPPGAQVWESSEDDSLASVDPITGASWTIRGAAVGPPVASLLAALGGTSAGGSAAWTPFFVSLRFSLFIVLFLFSADSGRYAYVDHELQAKLRAGSTISGKKNAVFVFLPYP